jgi:hypothetical protein
VPPRPPATYRLRVAVSCAACAGEIEGIKPEVCCKMQQQTCCINNACAMPCDDEVPCMIACLGVQCVKNYAVEFKFASRMESLEVEGNAA